MRYSFTLFRVKSKVGAVWHVRFWDEGLQKYARSRSTGISVEGKKERRREAEEAAKTLLEAMNREKLSPPRSVSEAAVPIPVKAGETPGKPLKAADMPLVRYLTDFWTPDSEYARYKRDVKKNPSQPTILR
jgi:hypothetical protein